MKFASMFVAIAFLAICSDLRAEVSGRFVRFEAPVSPRMGIHDIEIHSGGRNVVTANKELKVSGTGPKGVDINDRNHVKSLFDGKVEGRSVTLDAVEEVNPWVEIDLGKSMPIEKFVVKNPGAAFRERHWRLASVLDDKRKVVWALAFDMRGKEWQDNNWNIVPVAGKSALIGKTIPANSNGWVRLTDILPVETRPAVPQAEKRRDTFAKRNSPEGIESLSRTFFARVDLNLPELAACRSAFEKGQHAQALDAWRDYFLKNVQKTSILNEHEMPRTNYSSEAEDLLSNTAVSLVNGHALAWRMEPGLIDWSYIAPGAEKAGGKDDATLIAARYNVFIHNFSRALLTAFAKTGDERCLNRWAECMDDWGMHLQSDLARSNEDIRDYFVKEAVQHFNFFCFELQLALRERPETAQKMPAATLARALMPVLDEYGPAYWFVCRRAAFNHTFNALNAAYTTSSLLRGFHAGARLAQENRQHWERIFTFNITRDGTMIEIGDEGHLDMHLRIGALYTQMEQDQPAWFTPEFQARFRESYEQTGRYLVRHMTSNGMGHRYGTGDHFARLWAATEKLCSIGGMVPRERLSLVPVFEEPTARSIIETVFGRGRDRASLVPSRKEAYDAVTKFYGDKPFEQPKVVSDWMPYAGLHYLRRDWNPDASFMNIISQPTGSGEANGQVWNTEFRYWDYGVPLLKASPIHIDGRMQNPDSGKQTLHPGSKTERLTAASEQPIPARWHTSPRFDLAETFYAGAYQRVAVNPKSGRFEEEQAPQATRSARAGRSVMQVRPARAFVVLDTVDIADESARNKPRDFMIDYSFWSAGGADVNADAATHRLSLTPGKQAGVTMRHFAAQPIKYTGVDADSKTSRKPRTDMFDGAFELHSAALHVQSGTGLQLVTLVVPATAKTPNPILEARDLGNEQRLGFTAKFSTGSLTWLASKSGSRQMDAGPLSAEAATLMWWDDAGKASSSGGIVLGAKSISIGGKTQVLPSGDFEFSIRDGQLADVLPVLMPLGAPVILPYENAFIDSATVTIQSSSPGAEIHYTLDGKMPTQTSPRYTGPIAISDTSYFQARAFRPGAKENTFASAGVDASVTSYGRFVKRAPLPAAALDAKALQPGLSWDYYEQTWFALFSHLGLGGALPVASSGRTETLFDVSMRRADGPFGVRYSGFIDIPTTGVYTFHAPEEYVRPIAEPGYDLRVFVDDEEWNLGQQWHGLGQWSVPLQKGLHRFTVSFADARNSKYEMPHSNLWRGYPAPWVVWKKDVPSLTVSGPQVQRQPIPKNWLLKKP